MRGSRRERTAEGVGGGGVGGGDRIQADIRNPRTDGSKSFRYIVSKPWTMTAIVVGVAQELASRSAPSRARRLVRKDDVLFCLVRPYLRNIARVPPELDGQVASTAFCVLRPSEAMASRFLFRQVLRDSFIGEVPTYGTSPPSAREDEFLKQRIPLAPLPEQHRIVAEGRVPVRETGGGRRRAQACRGQSGALSRVRPQGGGRGQDDRTMEEGEPARGDRRATASAHPGRTAEALGGGAACEVRGQGKEAAPELEGKVQGAGRAGHERVIGATGRVVLGDRGSSGERRERDYQGWQEAPHGP